MQLNGRFLLVCVGVWLYAVDSLVTATDAPAIAETTLIRGEARIVAMGAAGFAVAVPSRSLIGMAVGFSRLSDGVSMVAAKTAGFWVFAAFVPVLGVALVSAWLFTRQEN